MKQVKVCLGRFQPFTLGHLKMATYRNLQGPDVEQKECLREQPDLKEISKQKTIILAVSTPASKVDSRHPFSDAIMKEEFDLIKERYSDDIEDVIYVKSADICAWGEILKSRGYQASVWLTGSDEFKMYKSMAIKVPEYEIQNRYNYDCKDAYTKSFYVEKIERTNDGDFVSSISGTKVRKALIENDEELFAKMMPKGASKYFKKFRDNIMSISNIKEHKSNRIFMSFKRFILEDSSRLTSLREQIKAAIDVEENEEFLYKINKQLHVKNPNELIRNIERFLNSRNIKKEAARNIIQKIKHYVCLNEIDAIVNVLNNNTNIPGVTYFTSADLKRGGNIFDNIQNFIKSIPVQDEDGKEVGHLEYDSELDSFLKDLSQYSLGGKVAAGKYEYLVNMFIKDWSDANNVVGDVTTESGGFELKAYRGRIAGNKDDTKIKETSILDEVCKNSTLGVLSRIMGGTFDYDNVLNDYKVVDEKYTAKDFISLNDDTYEVVQELYKSKRIFETINNISKFIDMFKQIFTSDSLEYQKRNTLLNDIFKEVILKSFTSLFKSQDVIDMKDQVFQEFESLKFDIDNVNDTIQNIRNIWLFVCLLHYRYTEGFNYLTVFSEDNDGRYVTFDLSVIETIVHTIYNIIFGNSKNKIQCESSKLPKNTKGSNSQNHAAAIELV